MPTCDHLQPFQDKTYEEEGSRGGGEEGEGRGERVRGPGDPKLGGGLLIFIATPSFLLSPSCSMILSWERGGVYKSLVVCL